MGNADQVDAPQEIRKRMAEQAQTFSVSELLRIIRAFNTAATEGRMNWQPGLPLELAFVESVESQAVEFHPVDEGTGPAVSSVPRGGSPARPTRVATPDPPPVSPGESAPSSLVTSDQGLTVNTIKGKWAAIRAAVKKENISAEGLLNSYTVLDLRGNKLYIGFASNVLKSKMEDPERLNAAQKGLEQVMGVPLQIQCVIATDAQSIPPEVDEAGMVAAAVRLGGKIVDSREIPARDSASKTQ
jgi:DNA polymerase-3 subunit gamma/tau